MVENHSGGHTKYLLFFFLFSSFSLHSYVVVVVMALELLFLMLGRRGIVFIVPSFNTRKKLSYMIAHSFIFNHR